MRRALLTACGPLIVYLATVLALVGLFVMKQPPSRRLSVILDFDTYYGASFYSGVIAAAVFLILLTVQSKRPRQLRDNWEQCSLAGLTGGQMLLGIGSPVIAGAILFGTVHSSLYFSLYFLRIPNFREMAVVLGIAGLFPISAVLICTIVDLAMWVLAPGFAVRAAAGLIAGFMTSVVIWIIGLVALHEFFSIPPLGWAGAWFNDLHSVLLCEALVWPFRVFAACWLLRFAIRRLDPDAKRRKKRIPDAVSTELRRTLLVWGALWLFFNFCLWAEGRTCLEIVRALARKSGNQCPGLNGDTLMAGQVIVGAAANAVFLCGPLAEFMAGLFFDVRMKWSKLVLLAGALIFPAWWILVIFFKTFSYAGRGW
jgi:hypothetical protein